MGCAPCGFCPVTYSDTHFEREEFSAYAAALLDTLSRIPRRVGIVWTGPNVISYEITNDDARAARRRFGKRRLLLYDNFPVNMDHRGKALALVIGPLRHRDPALTRTVAAYLTAPMNQLGASRLPLFTIADFLDDPAGYDPDASFKRAQQRLAGDDPETLEALRVQGIEWGGWVDERNYRNRRRRQRRHRGGRSERPDRPGHLALRRGALPDPDRRHRGHPGSGVPPGAARDHGGEAGGGAGAAGAARVPCATEVGGARTSPSCAVR